MFGNTSDKSRFVLFMCQAECKVFAPVDANGSCTGHIGSMGKNRADGVALSNRFAYLWHISDLFGIKPLIQVRR